MKNEITLILLTLNRHHLLDNILSFLDEFEVKIIVMDATESKFIPQFDFKNIEYYHAPGVHPLARFREATKRTQTPYTMVTADDIYPSLSFLKKSLAFLESNPDYAAIQGKVFFNSNGKIVLRRPEAHFFQADADCPATRLLQFFTYYHPVFYSLQRTECLQFALDRFPEGVVDYNFCELYFALILIAQGKVATVNSFHQVICDEPKSTKNFKSVLATSKNLVRKNKYYPELATLKNDIVNYLVEEKGISTTKATFYVDNTMRIMMLSILPKKNKWYWMRDRPPKTFMDRIRFELNALFRRVGLPIPKPPKPRKTSIQDVLAEDPTAAEDYKRICKLIGCSHQ
ncbi:MULTISPECIES: TIGR00180 family glycosyltransferase [unclassified Pseudodesulfovibrio]|uniref:TIGR00180 family glycosyltransferase n=1 Tax=unclassified Pseudodesulfovibrio TaxID=2661612 RepID=UPI000FEB6409|nr:MULTISPECIES: TIGR00180 family glycosyltransferase [unclassified Pseudodesulfovibrio]MCJ2163219.1 TIGR00180 family glycosyltransferase [Pseudodesulfovibrio sp. S3-i]RWU07202.1 TIGR00180 family glycosyltransferase [Pseudodesulfovibrio sp. S3]